LPDGGVPEVRPQAPAAKVAEEGEPAVEPAKPRRRASRKVAGDTPAEEPAAASEEAKPKRRTTRKVAAHVPADEPAPVAEEAKPKRQTTRKAAVDGAAATPRRGLVQLPLEIDS